MATGSMAPVEIVVSTTTAADAQQRRCMHDLFAASYAEANHGYLDESLAKFRFVAMALAGDEMIGFALGDMRCMDLPRLPQQPVALAGICCVDARFRRRGLFTQLEQRAFGASGITLEPRVLSCGRVAHPASFRTMTWNPTHIPKRHVAPTAWQREIGIAIAIAYGVSAFDPDTFVCKGSGTPIGYPKLEMAVEPHEWEPFACVDRSRGDSLLGLLWMPDAPAGW